MWKRNKGCGALRAARDHEGASQGRSSGRGDNYFLYSRDTFVAPPGFRSWVAPPLMEIPGGRGTRLPGFPARRTVAPLPALWAVPPGGVSDSPGAALTRAIHLGRRYGGPQSLRVGLCFLFK